MGNIISMVYSATEKEVEITKSQLKSELDNSTNIYIIDVRKPEELKSDGSINGAINIPREFIRFIV